MFQNYYQPQMQMGYPQNFNPYMQRMENLQQFQQSIQQPVMQPQQMQTTQMQTLGKVVENVDTVKTTEIPYQGVYFFPKADGTEIYSKQWLENGQTRILTYKPIIEDDMSNSSANVENTKIDALVQYLGDIQNGIKLLNDKVDKLHKTKNKKEIEADE